MSQYHIDQLKKVEKTHDKGFPMIMKIYGTGENTHAMDITLEQFYAIKNIMKGA